MNLKLIDAHTHLNFEQFDTDRAAVIERLKAAGVGAINVGTDLASSEWAIKLAHENPDFMWATVGLHPTDVEQGFDFETYKKLAQDPKVVAIGETGLDVRNPNDKAQIPKQLEIFKKQIELAREVNKPLMLHIRNAYQEVLEVLDYDRGNVHFFAGNMETAKKFLDLGFTLSFTGVVTFTTDYDEVVKYVPLDRILVETDAPFVAPVPYRGKRNEPSYVTEVVKRIAELKGVSEADLAAQTLANTQRVFGLVQ